MGPTFDQEQETCLRKATARDLIITAVAKGFSIVCRISNRLDGPIQSHQAHPFPEGPRGLLCGFGACYLHKEFLQQLPSQLASPVTQCRSRRDVLCHIVADRAQTAHHLAIDPTLRDAGIQMQSDQPVHDADHIGFAFSFFPHLVGLQKLFYHAWCDYLLQQSHIDLVAHLVWQPSLCYRFSHEACPFARVCNDGKSMPSGLPLRLLFSPFFPILVMRYFYLNSIGGHPDPRQRAAALSTPALKTFQVPEKFGMTHIHTQWLLHGLWP